MTVHLVMRDALWYRYCMMMGTGLTSPRTVSQLYRPLLKLHVFICISIKASWDDNKETSVPAEISNTAKAYREDHTKCSSCEDVQAVTDSSTQASRKSLGSPEASMRSKGLSSVISKLS